MGKTVRGKDKAAAKAAKAKAKNARRAKCTLALGCALALACAGCASYRGGKIVEGTDIAAGMSIPQSGGTLQVDALNFLTGFRFLFAENAGVKCIYSTTNSVSAFGIYQSATVKRIEITLEPTVDEAAEEDAAKGDGGAAR